MLRHAAWFYAATFVLILVWGVWQTGSMYSFNGFFYFSFIYVLGLFLVAGLALTLEAVELRWLRLAGWAVALALPGLVFHQPSIPSEGTGLTLRDSVFKALAADTQRVKPVFLAFEHKNWPEAAGVALALKRQGRDYYVHPFYGFMFGPEHCIDGAAGAFHPSDYSLWQIARFPVAAGRLVGLPPPGNVCDPQEQFPLGAESRAVEIQVVVFHVVHVRRLPKGR